MTVVVSSWKVEMF